MRQMKQLDKRTQDMDTSPLLPDDPDRAIQEMMDIIDGFRGVMEEETLALRRADVPGFMALQDRKLECGRSYQSGMAQLLARKDAIRTADPTLKERLEAQREDFSGIAMANLAALERMRNSSKRLGERIMDAVRQAAEREQQYAYGANGQMQRGGKGSIGVNESV